MYVEKDLEGLNDIYQLMAQTISVEDTIKLYNQFKGLTITFPTKLISREYIIKTLKMELVRKKELTKKEIQNYARRYNYSERQIKRFVVEAKKDLQNGTVCEEIIPYIEEWLEEQKKDKEDE